MDETAIEPLNIKPNLGASSGQEANSKFLYLSAFTANLIAFASGVSFGWTSPVIPKLKTDGPENPFGKPLTPIEESLLASLLYLGTTIGPLVSGQIASRIGRKKTLLLVAFPMLVSFLMTAFGHHLQVFYIARLFLGFGSGCVFAILPPYLAEIAEDHNRGTLCCLFGVFASLGMLFAYIAGPLLSIQNFSLSCTVSLIIFVPVFYFFIPETPTYLLSIGDEIGAKESLRKLRGTNEVNKEIMELGNNMGSNKGGALEIFKSKPLRKALIITNGLMFFQRFGGINAVLSYMESIFTSTGSGLPGWISTIIVGTIQFFVTIIASSVVDRLGRRILLLVSSVFSSLSLGALGLFFYLKTNQFNIESISWLPVTCLIVYIISFNLGLGPLPWALLGELFPSHVKGIASTITSFFCFFMGFIITILFPPVSKMIGMDLLLWLFSLICISCTIFVYFLVPETKGKTIREILQDLNGANNVKC